MRSTTKVATRLLAIGACAVVSAATATPAAAQPVYWADWTARTFSSGTTAGSATGTLNVNGTPVGIAFSGEVNSATNLGGGTNYWTSNRASYLGGVLTDAAPIPSDVIGFDGGTGIPNSITFSQAIVNPIFSFVSVGRSSVPVTLTFNNPFELVAQGPGFFGTGTLVQNGNSITGIEGNGTIRFLGTYNSIAWTSGQNGEFFGGFTIGVQGVSGPVSTVPEPATVGLVALGLVGIAAGARKRRTA
jgi:hypothetical protein